MKGFADQKVGWGMVSLSLVLAMIGIVGTVSGQGQGQKVADKAPAEKAPVEKAPVEKAPAEKATSVEKATKAQKQLNRLPAYYGEVVSKEQRAKIYEIQARYGDQVTKLRDQIEMLEKQLMSEVEGVLSPDQREQIAKRTAEAKAKRVKKTQAPAEGAPAENDAGNE